MFAERRRKHAAQADIAERLRADLAKAEAQGIKIAAGVRLATLALVFFWILFDFEGGTTAMVFQLSQIIFFVITGLGFWVAATRRGIWQVLVYLLIALDCVFMGLTFSIGNPFLEATIPPENILKYHNFFWFYLFLMFATFSLRPIIVIWTGICIMAVRAVQIVYVLSFPEIITHWEITDLSAQAYARLITTPGVVEMDPRVAELIATVGVTAGLAFVVRRTRTLVRNQVGAERQRANLARYFSPNVVDELADDSASLDKARVETVAIVFVDIVGFTRTSQEAEPTEVIDQLRSYYDRLGQQVFAHNGTLDKYLGDGLMATFGTPWPTPTPAADALGCVVGMVDSLAALNRERLKAGQRPVRAAIGAHYGPAIMGNVGNTRRLEFAVLGDSVNVANRLEEATRLDGVQALVSDDLVGAARQQAGQRDDLFARLRQRGPMSLRGREGIIQAWAIDWPPGDEPERF